jgi:PadR family transcriptional regulator PadR
MTIRLKQGDLDACVLSLLSQGDGDGYALATALAGATDAGEGDVYPAIRRMVHADWISTYLVEVDDGPPQRLYRMESKGRDVLVGLRGSRERLLDDLRQALWGANS